MAEVAFRQLRKQYPPRRGSAAVEVLKGIDLEVRDGEFGSGSFGVGADSFSVRERDRGERERQAFE